MKPEEVQYRCWGLQKLPGYDYENLPFIMARDNLGIQLIDVRSQIAYMFSDAPIMANLFGHGNIMALCSSEQKVEDVRSESGMSLARETDGSKSIKLWCVAQYSNHI